MMRALLSSLAAATLLSGCPESKKTAEPPTTCAKVGDSCTYAPGKLGLCIEPADGSGKLICQSQH